MKRTDIKIERGKIIIHPKDLETMKKAPRAKFGAAALDALRECVLDAELEAWVEEIVAAAIAEEMRAEIRSMLLEGVK